MNQYPNIESAFKTHSTCPFCKSPIQHGYTCLSETDGQTLIEFDFHGTKLVVDYQHNKIIEYGTSSGLQDFTSKGTGSAYMFTRYSNIIQEFVRVIGACADCQCYSYIIQVKVNLKRGIIEHLFLNSEIFSFEQGKTLYEIKNNYAVNKTRYDVFTEGLPDLDPLTLPLIPMDMSNPTKTLERIKTLVIFS